MSGRIRLEPKEHIPGEWNIILLNRYMPVSSGDHGRDLVAEAKDLRESGLSLAGVADLTGVSRQTVSYWEHKDWKTKAQENKRDE